MTALRPLSLSLHGAFELLLGVLALVAPFALSFTPAGTVLSFLIGVLAIGLALDTTAPRDVTAHQGFDYALAIGALLAALPLAWSSDGAAALALAAFGVAQLALTAGTRYSVRG
jgi:NO-binding membrane sensor protein with MHYT domain